MLTWIRKGSGEQGWKRAVLGALMGPGKIRLKKLSQQDSPHLVHREGSEKGKSLTDHAEKEGNIRGR